MYDLSGRVALVTGAGPNIGRAIAATLARAGATVLCNDLKPAIAEAAAKSAGEGGKAFPLPFDITNPGRVDKAIDAASRKHGTIDILVNNAGVTIPKGILTISVDEWRLVTRTIQEGAFLCSRAVAKRLVDAKKPGAIVNIGIDDRAIAAARTLSPTPPPRAASSISPARWRLKWRRTDPRYSVSPTKTGASVGAYSPPRTQFDEIPLGRLGNRRTTPTRYCS